MSTAGVFTTGHGSNLDVRQHMNEDSIYNGILSHKNEYVWVSPSEVYNPRACYTEWSKSERNILLRARARAHTHTHIWKSTRMVLTYLLAEQEHWDTNTWTQQGKDRVGQAEGHWNISLRVRQTAKGSRCVTQGAQPGALWQPRGVRWVEGGREV